MNSFVIGRVVAPEITKTSKGDVLRIGILVARQSLEFSVFEVASVDKTTGEFKRNPAFDRATKLKDGDNVACIVSPAVNKKGTDVVYYLRDIAPVDDSVSASLKSAFNPLDIKK